MSGFRLLVALFLVGILAVPILGVDPQISPSLGTNKCIVWYGETDLPNDTIWHPGVGGNIGFSDSVPAIYGVDLTPYRSLCFHWEPIQADTTHNDSIFIDLWTGFYGHVDSVEVMIPPDSLANGVIFDTCIASSCPEVQKCIDVVDSSGAYWPEKYVWMRIRTFQNTAFDDDTTTNGVVDVDMCLGGSDPASGSGIHDWWATNGDDSWETELDGTFDSSVFLMALGSDSTVCMFETPSPVAENPGIFDSVVYSVYCRTNADVVTACSLRMGIAVGDTQYCLADSITGGYGAAVVWSAAQAVPDAYEFGELRFKFTTDPRGREWERSWLADDSVIVILDACHIDTVAAGTNGPIRAYTLVDTLYSTRTQLHPKLKYRASMVLREK